MNSRWQKKLTLSAGVLLLGVSPFVVAGRFRTPTNAPPLSITDPTDPAQRGAVLEYARSLQFDYTHGAFGENLLDTLGTVGKLYPEVHNGRLDEGKFPKGRIQLRVEIIPPSDHPGVGFRSFPPGISYVWVQDIRNSGDSGTARGIIIPADPTLATRVMNLTIHQGPRVDVPLARWTELGQCWSCVKFEWCH